MMPKRKVVLTPEEYRRKWGIPDWRDAGAYPNAENMGDRAWRWEFLRRREDYREDWKRKGDPSKYGLAVMVDPRSKDGFIRFEDHLGLFSHGQTVNTFWAMGLNPWVSEAEHIQNLKNLLRNMRAIMKWKQPRHDRDNLTIYLRIVDARAESTKMATFKAIGEALRPDLSYSDAAAWAKQNHNQAIDAMKKLTTLEIN